MSSQCCLWSEGDPILEEYHDHEWCKINHDDDFQFEMLCLEGVLSGELDDAHSVSLSEAEWHHGGYLAAHCLM